MTLRSSLKNSNITFVQFQVQVSDQGNPEKTDTESVAITIKRDQYTPQFRGLPYEKDVNHTIQVNSFLMTVRAVDDDQKVRKIRT